MCKLSPKLNAVLLCLLCKKPTRREGTSFYLNEQLGKTYVGGCEKSETLDANPITIIPFQIKKPRLICKKIP